MGIYPPSSSLLAPQRYAVRAGGNTSLFPSARSWKAKKSTEVSARESLIKLIRETLNCRAHGVHTIGESENTSVFPRKRLSNPLMIILTRYFALREISLFPAVFREPYLLVVYVHGTLKPRMGRILPRTTVPLERVGAVKKESGH